MKGSQWMPLFLKFKSSPFSMAYNANCVPFPKVAIFPITL